MTDRTMVADDRAAGVRPAGTVRAVPDVYQETRVVTARDRVRWGPILAGLVVALGTFLLLSTLALAIGVLAAPSGTDTANAGAAAGIVSAVIALLSFFVGGFVAARTAAIEGRATGALNGFLVWAVGILVILVMAAFGLGQLFGAAGDLFGQYRSLGSPTSDLDASGVAEAVRAGAVGAFLGLVLPAAAAALGGFLGTRDTAHSEAFSD